MLTPHHWKRASKSFVSEPPQKKKKGPPEFFWQTCLTTPHDLSMAYCSTTGNRLQTGTHCKNGAGSWAEPGAVMFMLSGQLWQILLQSVAPDSALLMHTEFERKRWRRRSQQLQMTWPNTVIMQNVTKHTLSCTTHFVIQCKIHTFLKPILRSMSLCIFSLGILSSSAHIVKQSGKKTCLIQFSVSLTRWGHKAIHF